MFEVAMGVTLRDGNGVGNVLARAAEVVEAILRASEEELTSPEAQAIRQAADAAHST